MIVLDTNVVSEPIRRQSNPAVIAWLDQQLADTLYLTATSLSELLVGIALMPTGKRRKGIAAALEELLTRLFGSRVLAFDQDAAKTYATIVSRARNADHVISVGDGQIAAIAATRGFAVATRDTAPFIKASARIIGIPAKRLQARRRRNSPARIQHGIDPGRSRFLGTGKRLVQRVPRRKAPGKIRDHDTERRHLVTRFDRNRIAHDLPHVRISRLVYRPLMRLAKQYAHAAVFLALEGRPPFKPFF